MKCYFPLFLSVITTSNIHHAIGGNANDRVGNLRRTSSRSLVSGLSPREIPDYPLDRFQDWNQLNSTEQKLLSDILGYDEDSWNLPMVNTLELLSFDTIANWSAELEFEDVLEVGKKQGEVPTTSTPIDIIWDVLNITEYQVWDCHINHYHDYTWEDAANYTSLEGAADGVNTSIIPYLMALGWTQETYDYDGNGPPPQFPPSEDKFWYELTEEEKIAAEALCYFPELWAGDVEISDWIHLPKELALQQQQQQQGGGSVTTITNTPDVPIEIHPTIEYWDLPKTPLTVWSKLTAQQKMDASLLGYNETTWNFPGIAAVNTSYYRWGDLTPASQLAAEGLGLDEFYWDCLIQHYDNYQWAELKAKGVKYLFEALNWDYSAWHGIVAPPTSANQTFDQLGQGQKMAAKQLCYLPQTYLPTDGGLSLLDLNSEAFTDPSPAVSKSSPTGDDTNPFS